jgi:hypothetical protein
VGLSGLRLVAPSDRAHALMAHALAMTECDAAGAQTTATASPPRQQRGAAP